MKGIKITGLAVLTALALTAFSGVASASGPSFFAADAYPATLKGEATGEQGKLGTVVGISKCWSPALTGTLSKPSETLTTSVKYGTCDANLNANGCEFTFHPPAEGINGTFDIGGSKCSGITGSQTGAGIKILIHPQSGLAATFENEGSGAGAKVKIQAQVTGLKYDVTTEGAFKGSYSNGTYNTIWSVNGEHNGSSTGVKIHSFPGLSVIGGGEISPEFHSELYPATIGGKQISGTVHGLATPKIRLKTAAGIAQCETATFSSSVWAPEGLGFDTSELLLSPTVGSCSLAGLGATVTPSAGCTYTFGLTSGLPYVGSLFVCETVVASKLSKCTITVPGQTRSGVEYLNVGSGSGSTVEAKADLSGVAYQITNGKECPNKPSDGSYSDGEYRGVVSLNVAKVN